MDLRDSPDEAAFRSEARAFLDAHAPEGGLPTDNYADPDADAAAILEKNRAWQRALHEHGWAALGWPKQFGGQGRGPIEGIIWNQEQARANIGESLFMVGIGMAGPTIITHGTDAQKQRHLEPTLRADEIWCQLFSEPGAGSDLAGVATRAVREGDEWVITGQKTWCSGGHYSDWGILITRTDPSVPKHQGLTYFLVDMKSPGIEIRPLRQLSGSAHFNEVFLEGVRIPDANRVGDVGQGWAVTNTTLMNERMSMGGVERMMSFEELREFVVANTERVDDVLRDELAELYTWWKGLEMLNARVITKLGKGQNPLAEASVMKLAIARILTRATDVAMRAMGPDAMLRKGFWQNQWAIAPAFHIAGGTDEIQRNIAAEKVLGLPREPSNDRDLPFEQLPRG